MLPESDTDRRDDPRLEIDAVQRAVVGNRRGHAKMLRAPLEKGPQGIGVRIARRLRRLFQFRLRTFFFIVTMVAIVCEVLGRRFYDATLRRIAVNQVLAHGGTVGYPYDKSGPHPADAPEWLIWLCGEDYFRDVWSVRFVDCPEASEAMPYVARFTKLRFFQSDHTDIGDDELRHLSELTDMESLILSDCKITGAGLVHLQQLTKLKRLKMPDTNVDDAGLQYLKEMRLLTNITLRGTLVQGDGLRHLVDFPYIGLMSLSDSPLCDEAVPHLIQIQRIGMLSVERTNLTHDALNQLVSNRPSTVVVTDIRYDQSRSGDD